jgi:type I restriction enzyme, S subunit
MAGEWRDTTLGEVTDFLSGGTPSKDRPDYWVGSVPWVSAKDMKRFRLDDSEDHVSEDAVGSGTKLVPAESVLLLARGMTLLNDVPICVISRPMTFNQDVKALRAKPHVRNDYLPYLLLGNKDRLLSLVDLAGHGTGRLNSDELKALDVALPPPDEQRAIAHILGTLDDKIELNRRMNETLEAMARALFKSWFVDFDPVRAKAEGRDTGLPKPLADLFPARLVESELGEIPEGWSVRPLRDLTNYLSRGLGPAYVESGGVRVLNQKCIRERRVDFAKARRHDESTKPVDGRLLRRLDVLVNSTGVGTLGRVAQLLHLSEPTVVDSHVTVVRAAPGVDPWFLGLGLAGRESEIEALGEGSTGQTELSRIRLGDLACIAPPSEIQRQFGRAAAELLGRMSSGERESDSIAALRDALLSKLISGELRVDDAEKFVERPV